MSTLVKAQPVFGTMATARVESHPKQMISRRNSEPAVAELIDAGKQPVDSVVEAAKPVAWDPHEVWLSRVKEPRERRLA